MLTPIAIGCLLSLATTLTLIKNRRLFYRNTRSWTFNTKSAIAVWFVLMCAIASPTLFVMDWIQDHQKPAQPNVWVIGTIFRANCQLQFRSESNDSCSLMLKGDHRTYALKRGALLDARNVDLLRDGDTVTIGYNSPLDIHKGTIVVRTIADVILANA